MKTGCHEYSSDADLKMGHLGFLSNLQEPLPLPNLIYSQVFMINQCRIKYLLENTVYAFLYFRTIYVLLIFCCYADTTYV